VVRTRLERQVIRTQAGGGLDQRQRLLGGLCLCFFLGNAGCGGGRPQPHTEYYPFTEEEQKLWQEAADAHYQLRVGDTFMVDFKYQDELDRRDILILPDGRFTLAGVEDVRAAGLTIPELDTLLTQHYSEEYHNPDLSIIIQKLGPQPVYVYGEVNHPGSYEIPATGAGILQAISMASGFTEYASTSQVLLVRVQDGGYLYKIFDLSHLEKRGLVGLDPLFVQPNDVLYVPRSALGDLKLFSSTVLTSLLQISQLFWNTYAITRIDRVRLVN